jgi:hypothetical protein
VDSGVCQICRGSVPIGYTQDIKFSDAIGIQDCGFKGRPISKPEESLSLHLCMPFLLVYRMNPMA